MTPSTSPTIASTAAALAGGTTSSRDLVDQALARAGDAQGEGPHTFTRLHAGAARAAAEAADTLRRAGLPPASPLAGVPISIKDLLDVAGETTTAGSRVLAGHPAATRDAPIVARLRRAGAAIVGRTTMTEFAYSGLGINPHYGTPRCPWDRATGRIPGGSSSGAAVSVTDGFALGAIGTDTGGSVRIPAAVCGIVGFKPTAARVPRDGCLPLSTSFDSIGPLAHSVACCIAIDRVLAWEDIDAPLPEPTPAAAISLAVPGTVLLDELEPPVAAAFERALSRLSAAGCRLTDVAMPPLDTLQDPAAAGVPADVVRAFAAGGIAAAEAFAWHRLLLATREPGYDPRVAKRIRRAEKISMPEYIALVALRRALIAEMHAITRPYTAIVCPTLPIIPPALAPLIADDALYGETNQRILRNTAVGNYLDRCAITLPCHEPGTAPVGLMLIGEHMGDAALLRTALTVEAILAA
jgi:aspartyl-tRNA(Asn)/glutamyl-tRNA(Gln) amidotransferase subunit A